MSCGTKLNSYHSNYDLGEALERQGEYSLAGDVRNGRCLDDYDLRRAEQALESEGLYKRVDYYRDNCSCESDYDE